MTADAIDEAVDFIRAWQSGPFPKTALVLGSGLGKLADRIEDAKALAYRDIPGFPVPTVAEHRGQLVVGGLSATPVVCMQGRLHLYEGYAPQTLAIPIRTLRGLGVERILMTNAAGSLRPDLAPGALMVVEDHINLTAQNPLAGPNDERFGPRYVDMTDAYDKDLRARLDAAAAAVNVGLAHGVYVQMLGPSFETAAEVRLLARLGADAVGMSTVQEALVARHCGMKVAALSLITNFGTGLSETPLTVAEVFAVADRAYAKIEALLLRFFHDLRD